MLIDVADYRHVPAGPGVLLIGHEANYSLDNRREPPRPAVQPQKAALDGTFQERLAQAHGRAWRPATAWNRKSAFAESWNSTGTRWKFL